MLILEVQNVGKIELSDMDRAGEPITEVLDGR